MDYKENERPYAPEAARSTLNRFNKPLPIPLQESPFNLNNRDLNFSRKREPSSPLRPASGTVLSGNESKRHKKNTSTTQNDKFSALPSRPTESIGHFRTVSDGRQSRFREETMRDQPSYKPPSMFLRILPGASRLNPSVDHLMEGYHVEQSERPSIMQNSRKTSRSTQLSGLTHHPNASISSNATLAMSTQSRDSGFSRFGRSLASSMNPVSLWQRVTKTRGSKEVLAEYDDDELAERQLRAEQTYATLKREGRLGMLGSRARSTDFITLAAGYAPEPDLPSQRDSGVDMTADLRSSEEMGDSGAASTPVIRRISDMPGKRSTSKKFHLRTPSFQDLKRIASDINLHRRTTSESTPADSNRKAHVVSPTVDIRPTTSAAQTPAAMSRKEIERQAKLAKKASDLEAKLASVRRELHQVKTDEVVSGHEVEVHRPKRSALLRKRFEPLPALPSESLLLAEEESRPKTAGASVKYLQNLPPSPAKDHAATVEITTSASKEFLPIKEPVSVFESSSVEVSPDGPIRKAFKKPKKLIRSSTKANLRAESNEAISPPKKGSPQRVRPKANAGSPAKLRGSISSPILGPVETSDEDRYKDLRSSLDTVQEESYVALSFKIAINSPPAHPTAFATPANPRGIQHRHACSVSPVKNNSVLSPGSDRETSQYGASPGSLGPNINFSRPTTPRKENQSPKRRSASSLADITASPKAPRLAPTREEWEWPEDIF